VQEGGESREDRGGYTDLFKENGPKGYAYLHEKIRPYTRKEGI